MVSPVLKVLAATGLATLACIGLVQAQNAQELAREIDHRGDLRSCRQDNAIRRESNARNAKLEQTARITAQVVQIAGDIDRPGDPVAEARLRRLAREAEEIQTNFEPATLVDCNEVFPGPDG